MQEYINKIIKTGLSNGLTIEQITSNPEAAAKAYLKTQLQAIDKAGDQLRATA